MSWLERQRSNQPGALAVMMSGTTTVVADLANEIFKKLRYELLREPAEDEPVTKDGEETKGSAIEAGGEALDAPLIDDAETDGGVLGVLVKPTSRSTTRSRASRTGTTRSPRSR